jgi:NADPH2:quinone reductase
MKAIRVHQTGEPEVMRLEEIETPVPKAGEVLIKVAAAGVNYADLAQRAGAYLTPTRTPMTPGMEIAGTVVALGDGVSSVSEGTRVAAFCDGGYAEYAISRASMVIPIPPALDFTQAAAFPLQGITAYQLLQESAGLQSGESVLVHAAAGGVGTLAIQLAKLMGAGTVIGTASSTEKLELARSLGADSAINYTEPDWVEQVKNLTGGKGANIILEMVGGTISEQSLQCLAPFGRMVIYGVASREIAQFTGPQLMYKNQAIIGYWLASRLGRTDRITAAIMNLMQYLLSGQLKIIVGQTFPLDQAVEAHRAIAARKTTGKVVLLV